VPGRHRGLLPTLLIWVLPCSIAVLVAIWFSALKVTQDTVEAELLARLDHDNRNSAARLGQTLDVLDQDTLALAGNDLIINALHDVASRDAYLPVFFRSLRLPGPDGARISFVDDRGRLLASNLDNGNDHTGAPWLAQVMAGRLYESFTTDGIVVAAPVMRRGEAEGAIVLEYDADHIPELTDTGSVATASAVVMPNGHVLASDPPNFAREGIGPNAPPGNAWVSVHSEVPGHPGLIVWTAEPREAALASLGRSKRVTVSAILFSLLAVTIGIVTAAWLSTRPLRQLADDLQHIRSTSQFGYRVTPFGTAEFRQLGRSFNDLLAQIEATTTSRDALARETVRRREAMKELNQFRDVLDRTLDMILMIDAQTLHLIYANQGLMAATGYSAEELHGSPVNRLGADLSEQQLRGFLKQLLSAETDVLQDKAMLQGKDGRRIPVEFKIQLVNTDAHGVLVAILRDISERQKAERALVASQRHGKAVLDAAVDSIVTIDNRGIIERVNPSTLFMFGYSEEELIGQNVSMLMPEPHRSDHDRYIERYLRTGYRRIIGIGREVTGQRRDGSTFAMEITVCEIRLGDQQFFTGMMRDITERKKIETMKTEFISTVSHELRTPLTSIIGALGLVRSGTSGDLAGNVHSMLDIAAKNADRLVRLINDMLDIEKIESGQMRFELASVDLHTLVREAIESNQPYADQYGVKLRPELPDRDVTAMGDRDRLLQVMTNLISNAVKFSPEGGEVVVALSVEANIVRIQVEDHGPGIAEEFKDRIFSKFAQADASDTREKGGTGLGLNICKAIIEKHHGRIGYRTEPGEGTTFFFELPASLGTIRSNVLEPREAMLRPVLVCEDDPDIARLIALMLKDGGFTCDVASTAAQARRKLRARNFAALTLDLSLPDMDGFSLLRELREDPRTESIPVIVVSATAEHDADGYHGRALGLVDWLTKPIDPVRLLRAARSALRSQLNRPRVLYVEDDPDVARVVSTVLSELADVDTASNLAEARSLIAGGRFDLAVLDLSLPDGSGEELIPLLDSGEASVAPVIIFSAQEASKEISRRVSSALIKSEASTDMLAEVVRRQIGLQNAAATGAPPEAMREHG